MPVYFQKSFLFSSAGPVSGLAAGSRRTGMARRGGANISTGIMRLYATGKVEGALTEHDVYTGATLSNADAAGRRKEAQSSGAVHDALPH